MSKRSQQIDALFRQGQQMHMTGRLPEAEAMYRQLISIAPRHADGLHALGALALQAGHPEAADTLLSQAIALKPSSDFRLTRAAALIALNRPDQAAEILRAVLRASPANAAAWQTLGHALSDSNDADGAAAAYRQALQLQPALPDIRNNLGTALRQGGHLEEAEAELRRAPPDPFALVNLSSVQKERGRFSEAEATLRQAVQAAPNHPVLRYNWALLMLLLGREAEAWDGWEQRFAANAIPPRAFDRPQWQGEPLNGRTLLVHAEQGLGDTIQFCRYLPALSAIAPPNPVPSGPMLSGQVLFESPPALLALLSSNPRMPRMAAAGTPLPPYDLVAPLMSLPARTKLIAAEPPYLFADSVRVAHWRGLIGQGGTRVGIAWQGNSSRHEDKGRSLPLAQFAPLASVPGVRLISLQKGEGEEQLPRAAFPVEDLGPLDSGPNAFLDTAAIMMAVDLVITSDTSIAHLAGALGVPVWVALRRVPDWRWLLDRSDSPWYPSMRLFRQPQEGDWPSVMQAMADALGQWSA